MRVLRSCSLRAGTKCTCGGLLPLCTFRREKQDQLQGRLAFLVSLQTFKTVVSMIILEKGDKFLVLVGDVAQGKDFEKW